MEVGGRGVRAEGENYAKERARVTALLRYVDDELSGLLLQGHL